MTREKEMANESLKKRDPKAIEGRDGSSEAFDHFDPITGNIRPSTEASKEQDVVEKAVAAGLVGAKRIQ